jgi:hypothetical protein
MSAVAAHARRSERRRSADAGTLIQLSPVSSGKENPTSGACYGELELRPANASQCPSEMVCLDLRP